MTIWIPFSEVQKEGSNFRGPKSEKGVDAIGLVASH